MQVSTTRKAEVLRLMVGGRTNRQITQRILAKLGVSNRVEAAATAYRLRLFDE